MRTLPLSRSIVIMTKSVRILNSFWSAFFTTTARSFVSATTVCVYSGINMDAAPWVIEGAAWISVVPSPGVTTGISIPDTSKGETEKSMTRVSEPPPTDMWTSPVRGSLVLFIRSR